MRESGRKTSPHLLQTGTASTFLKSRAGEGVTPKGFRHSSLWLLKLLYQRMRMDVQRHRLLSAQARSAERALQSDIPLTSLEQPLAPEEGDISKPCPYLYRTPKSQYE